MKDEYLERMKHMLKDEYQSYVEELKRSPRKGMRVNTLKTTEEELFSLLDYPVRKTSFALNGYEIEPPAGVGYSLPVLSGMMYLQEPSASSAVTILDPKPGMKVLDLCAAPGSKTTQILEKLQGEGLLVANEINHSRAKILVENVERNGAPNCIILNSDPKAVAADFAGFFDMVLCDAPCSGEGMFRKEDQASEDWSLNHVLSCARRQSAILEEAVKCLKRDGVMVYSTCTLNLEENEYVIRDFLAAHPEMELIPSGVTFGREAYPVTEEMHLCRRIFPMDGGEGHFIAKMHKKDSVEDNNRTKYRKEDKLPECCVQVLEDTLTQAYPHCLVYNNVVYGGTSPFPQCEKTHIMRSQVCLGEIINKRFEPAHHLFMSSYGGFKNSYEVSDEEAARYLHGEQLSYAGNKGWYALKWHGCALGGAKCDGKALKNKLPKGLRIR